MMEYQASSRYRNLFRLLKLYICDGNVSKYLALLRDLPNGAPSLALTPNRLELIYALANTSRYLSSNGTTAELKAALISYFIDLVSQLSRNKIAFVGGFTSNHHFQLTFHLVNAIILLEQDQDSNTGNRKKQGQKVENSVKSTVGILTDNLKFISGEIFGDKVGDTTKLIYYFVLFGYLFAFTNNPSILILRISGNEPKSSDKNSSLSSLQLLNQISSIVENHSFLNQLESIIANSLVISLNDSVANLNPSDSSNSNYRLLYTFNLNFPKILGSKNKSSEFSSLIFLKYLNLIRLNLILLISKIPIGRSKKLHADSSSVIESLVLLRSKELDLNESTGLSNNAADDNDDLPIDNFDNDSETSSVSFSRISSASSVSYLNISRYTELEKNLLLQICTQSLNQLSSFQNGASFIILSSLDRVNLIFENKSLILEIFSCLYFLKLINFEFIYKNLLSKNLLINYSAGTNYNSLVEDNSNIFDNLSISGYSHLGNTLPNSASTVASSDFADNNELANPSLSFNIFGLLSLLSMENNNDIDLLSLNAGLSSSLTAASYDNTLPVIINKKISFLIYNNPSLSFTKVLKKSLRCIALAYKHSSQDYIVGLIYSLINMLSVDKDEEPPISSSNGEQPFNLVNHGSISRGIPGTLRNSRWARGDKLKASTSNLRNEEGIQKQRNTVSTDNNNPNEAANDSESSIVNGTSLNNTASVIDQNGTAAAKQKTNSSFSQIHRTFENSIKAIIELTNSYNQEDITVLVITILVQKFRITTGPSEKSAGLNVGAAAPSSSSSSTASVATAIGGITTAGLEVNESKRISDLLNLLIIRNLYKLTYSLHRDKKNFLLLVKTYSNLLNFSSTSNNWELVDEVIGAYCKIARILKDSFYLIEKDPNNPSAGYVSLPAILPVSDLSYKSIQGFYDSNKRLAYDLTSPQVNENYKIFLHELLNSVISKGDNLNKMEDSSHHRSHTEISEVAKKIEIFLKPLSMLLPSPFENQASLVFSAPQWANRKLSNDRSGPVDADSGTGQVVIDDKSVNLFRNIWFNMIVHGMNIDILPLIIPSLLNTSSIDMPKLNKGHKKGISDAAHAHQRKLISYLKIIAYNSPPLASKLSWSHNENLLELNTVLRRGSSHSNARFQKSVLEAIVDSNSLKNHASSTTGESAGNLEKSIVSSLDNDIPTTFKGKISSTPKLMFLAATIFLEFLRIESGDIYKVLLYFSDPSIKLSNLEKDMKYIAFEVLASYLIKISVNFNSINNMTSSNVHTRANTKQSGNPLLLNEFSLSIVNHFSINHISTQLNEMLTLTCATNSFLQGIAIKSCDLLISRIPAVLSHQESFTLFKLLDLLNLLFSSIVNYEKLKYNPVLEYSLPNYSLNLVTNSHDITSFEKIILLDSLEWRQSTFEKLQIMAREWILRALKDANQVMKNLLQSYVVINSNISSTANNQLYSTIKHYKSDSSINFGVSFAVEMAKSILSTDKEIYNVIKSSYLHFPGSTNNRIDTLSEFLINYNINADLSNVSAEYITDDFGNYSSKLRSKVVLLYESLDHDKKLRKGKNQHNSHQKKFRKNNEIVSIIDAISKFLSMLKNSRRVVKNQQEIELYESEFTKYLIEIPFKIFNCDILKYCISHWLIISTNNIKLQFLIITEILKHFQITVLDGKGLFNYHHSTTTGNSPEYKAMEYAPSNKQENNHYASVASESFKIHLLLIRLIQSFFHSTLYQSINLLKAFNDFVVFVLRNFSKVSSHPFSRLLRFEFIRFALGVLQANLGIKNVTLNDKIFEIFKVQKTSSAIFDFNFVHMLVSLILDASLDWFKYRKLPPFGDNLLKIKTDLLQLMEVANIVANINFTGANDLVIKKKLLLIFLNDEINSIYIWLNPIGDYRGLAAVKDYDYNFNAKLVSGNAIDEKFISEAYVLNPSFAINLVLRLVGLGVLGGDAITYRLLMKKVLFTDPVLAINNPGALSFLLDAELYSHDKHLLTSGPISHRVGSNPLRFLLNWEPVSPVESVNLFLPPFGKNPYVLQYAMKSLASHDINVTFFYVPQIVQMLRYDAEGYVEKFVLETAQISQLFAHQIIWNMLANSYNDDEGTVPDDLKPKLDFIREAMTNSFSPKDYAYYEKEFSFFKEITGISGKLKPYIKKTKAEKKLKIDEEMRNIKVEPGVYLPSNPDGTLVDINRTSGKPLQSHAKAPFMATFKISKKVHSYDDDEENEDIAINIQDVDQSEIPTAENRNRKKNGNNSGDDVGNDSDGSKKVIETWQSAIFKVGDDCRQDMLALQLISVFRSIWANNNMDLYVFPYRVTATEAGCGIIDVLPNSVSRDMLGREAVNGLYQYFITKFGPEYSTEFQMARNNLIKSLAAYSIISYLLQFKDRHNGNIMYDDQGHVLHIDFGFCFDIVPGGVKFEAVPFKLTKEMVMVMGGSNDTQSFKRFEELCVQGFLAVRPYMEIIVKCVLPMLDSGLPCFKGMTTIKNLKARFVPQKDEKEAALFMRRLIRKSYESFFTKGYDEFQRLTNGIPY